MRFFWIFRRKNGAGSTFPPRNLNFCGSEGSDDELLQVLRQVSRIGRNRDDDLDVGGDLVDGVQDLGGSGHIVVGDAQDAVEEQLGNIVVACQHACHKAVQHISTGNRLNLSFEDMDRIVTEGEALGIHWYMCTGGEPTCRKEDLFKLAAKHQNSVFHLFTNGTLIDQAFCDRVKEVGNMAFFISIEGIGDATDARRGEGVYDRVMHAMDLMKENGLLFGTSICYTSANYKAVTSDEFMDMLISHGVRFNWYFHYMPIGDGANVDLMLNAEQREYMIHRVREIRGYTGGKPIFCIDFQNDGEYIDGCIAGGRQYAHINPAGDVEPCVFIHYSNANIHDKSLLECLQQPLFKEYHKGQPFNHNHLRPCPMLENPELLGEMVKRSGAHSTDMQQPESTDDVFRRCRPYADQWTPSADRIWAEEHPDCASCASCSACASK